MLAVSMLITLMIFMWGAAIWASWEEEKPDRWHMNDTHPGALTGA